MMPQKLNPDVAELARGKSGTAIGRLTGLAGDGEGAAALLQPRSPGGRLRCPRPAPISPLALSALVRGLEFDRERLAAAAADPLLLATDAAEELVREGVPFRDAHEQVAESVRDGSYEALRARGPARPGPGGVDAAVAAARTRLESV